MKKYTLFFFAMVLVFVLCFTTKASAQTSEVICPNGKTLSSNCTQTPTPSGSTGLLCPNGNTFVSNCTQGGSSGGGGSTGNFVFNRDLGIGSSGDDVRMLQQILSNQGYSLGVIDGSYGFRTAGAVSMFQTNNFLTATGYVDAATRNKLNSMAGPVTIVTPPDQCPLTVVNGVAMHVCSTPPPRPIPNPNSPVIRGVSGPQSLAVNQQGTWTVSASSPTGGNLSYLVNWGDEANRLAGQSPVSTSTINQSATFSHTYSRVGIYNPTFHVTNSSGNRAETSLSVNVGSIANTTTPMISYVVSANCPEGGSCPYVSIGEVIAIFGSNFNSSSVIYMDGYNGKLIRPNADRANYYLGFYLPANTSLGTHTIQVAQGGIGNPTPLSNAVNINVTNTSTTSPPNLTITTSSPLTSARVGNFYEEILRVSGVPPGYTTNNLDWLASDVLPPGLFLSASDYGMVITGTPTTAGTFNFSLTARTSTLSYPSTNYASTTKNFTLTVNPSDVSPKATASSSQLINNQSTYSPGQAIKFSVKGIASDGNVGVPEKGFNVQAWMQTPVDTVQINGIYQSFNATYNYSTSLWDVAMTAPSDSSQTYTVDTAFYCSESDFRNCNYGQINKSFTFILTGSPTTPTPPPTSSAPTISAMNSPRGNTIYAGDEAYIYGTGLKGPLNVRLGGVSVSVNNSFDTGAAFVVPSDLEGITDIVVTNNTTRLTSLPYRVDIVPVTGGPITPPPPIPTVPDQRPVGYLDAANCDIIGGWAYDADTPNDAINVHLYDGGAGVGTFLQGVLTTGTRPDVNTGFGITGTHGFTISTPSSLKDGNQHSVYAYAINNNASGSNPDLSGSPKTFTCEVRAHMDALGFVGPASPAFPNTSFTTIASIDEKSLGAIKFYFTQFQSEGSHGNEVMELQKFLKRAGYDVGNADGIFGTKTKTAVIKLQTDNKLKIDGIVGFEVRLLLNS